MPREVCVCDWAYLIVIPIPVFSKTYDLRSPEHVSCKLIRDSGNKQTFAHARARAGPLAYRLQP